MKFGQLNHVGAAIALLAAAGCHQSQPNEFICNDPPGFLTHAYDAAGEQRVLQQCIQKWGYRLGRAPGTNREIADATIGVCREALDQLRLLREKEKFKVGEQYTEAAWEKDEAAIRESALYRAVQGRAGNCSDHDTGHQEVREP